MEYRIRRATPADAAAVSRELAAYLASLGEPVDLDGRDRDVARWDEQYREPQGVLLLVVAPDGAEVGTAAVRLLAPGLGEIKRMWIRPGHRGRGLGRRLLEVCLDEARRLGCARVRLDTARHMAAALRLYRDAGFTEIPDYNDNPLAQVWMERPL